MTFFKKLLRISFLIFLCLIMGLIFALILFIFKPIIKKKFDKSTLNQAITKHLHTEICFGNSYSVHKSKTNSYYTLPIHNQEIIIPDWTYEYADDVTWIIVGITPNQKNAIYIVDKETVLQYFNQTDKNECKSLKQ